MGALCAKIVSPNLGHRTCSSGYTSCDDSITKFGPTSIQLRFKVDGTGDFIRKDDIKNGKEVLNILSAKFLFSEPCPIPENIWVSGRGEESWCLGGSFKPR